MLALAVSESQIPIQTKPMIFDAGENVSVEALDPITAYHPGPVTVTPTVCV